VGIGEAGLDHYRKSAPPGDQERAFRSQITVAKDVGVALVVHTRDAQADTKRVLRDEGPPEHLVMHCFSGDADDARDYLDLGAVLSFSGTVTFRNAPGVQDAARVCPLDRLLLETDSPFLSPHPYRGRPNSPARIPVIGAFVAALKDITPEDLSDRVAATARDVWAGRRNGGDW
jgi:TatD DNase family protein